jgi:hypothetical protein
MTQMGQCQLGKLCYSGACNPFCWSCLSLSSSPFSHKRTLKILDRQSEIFLRSHIHAIQTVTDKEERYFGKGVVEGHTMIGCWCNTNHRFDFSLDNQDKSFCKLLQIHFRHNCFPQSPPHNGSLGRGHPIKKTFLSRLDKGLAIIEYTWSLSVGSESAVVIW